MMRGERRMEETDYLLPPSNKITTVRMPMRDRPQHHCHSPSSLPSAKGDSLRETSLPALRMPGPSSSYGYLSPHEL